MIDLQILLNILFSISFMLVAYMAYLQVKINGIQNRINNIQYEINKSGLEFRLEFIQLVTNILNELLGKKKPKNKKISNGDKLKWKKKL